MEIRAGNEDGILRTGQNERAHVAEFVELRVELFERGAIEYVRGRVGPIEGQDAKPFAMVSRGCCS